MGIPIGAESASTRQPDWSLARWRQAMYRQSPQKKRFFLDDCGRAMVPRDPTSMPIQDVRNKRIFLTSTTLLPPEMPPKKYLSQRVCTFGFQESTGEAFAHLVGEHKARGSYRPATLGGNRSPTADSSGTGCLGSCWGEPLRPLSYHSLFTLSFAPQPCRSPSSSRRSLA